MARILFVKRYHHTRFAGGAEEQSWLLATEFARRGWDVHYVSEMNEVPGPGIVEGVKLHGLPENPPHVRGNRLPLRHLIRELRPDAIYVRSFDVYARDALREAPPSSVTIWASAMTGDGLIWPRLHQMRRLTSLPLYLKRLPIHFSIFAAAKRAIRHASVVFVQSPEQVGMFRERGLDTRLIRNVQPAVTDADVQRHDGRPMILWAASLKSWKRPEQFIELAHRCLDLDASFVMIGAIQEERYKDILTAAMHENPNFRWDGHIPLMRVREYFRRAHLFVNTSIELEGYPNSFIHAWLHGVPVVSLDVDPEMLLSETGFGVVARNMDLMEKAVRELVSNPGRRVEMGGKARAYALREHDLARIVDRIEEILTKKGVELPRRRSNAEFTKK